MYKLRCLNEGAFKNISNDRSTYKLNASSSIDITYCR